ncbi:DUF2516 family protein [Halostreptopolyspora alba]|uniref:DUF2516 family protein n=1 Tax=Halostreptopolyspora alba TaxID=2487137 RepID=A0A3N0E881_9ACTN|nr:DUF2516 family protein [Nocardiopsaceae bacterium YIM 96095]
MFGSLWQIIYIAIFVTTLYALIEAARTPAQAFPAADKQTKGLWTGLLGVGTFLSLSAAVGFFYFFSFLALVAALIYLLDVRPATRSVGRADGPYGPW